MGVKSCGRFNCENIMCDRLSSKHGYICDECFDELIATGPRTDIDNFMKSKKNDEKEESVARYNAVFKNSSYEQ